MAKKAKLGSGKRFKSLVKKLKSKKGKTRTGKSRKVKSPKKLAAWIMWRKYGKKGGKRLIKMGKRKKRK